MQLNLLFTNFVIYQVYWVAPISAGLIIPVIYNVIFLKPAKEEKTA